MQQSPLKQPVLEPGPEDPFENCLLKRKEYAAALTTFLGTIQEPFVIALASEWGAGKTTFLKMWKGQLDKTGFSTLYFNAWENDFTEDPLTALMGEIKAALEAKLGKTVVASGWKKVRSAGSKLGRLVLPGLVRVATAGFLDIKDEAESVISEAAETYTQKQIDEYEANKASIVEFRSELKKLVDELRTASGNSNPFIFIVDELDRCRPTYAVTFLERVRHLFSIEGLVFVIAIDRAQFGHAVGVLYGQRFDSDRYLRRFLDVEFALPKPPYGEYINGLWAKFGFETIFKSRGGNEGQVIHSMLPSLCACAGLSLRDIDQILTRLAVLLRMLPTYADFPAFLTVIFLVMRIKARDCYELIGNQFGNPGDGIQLFNEWRLRESSERDWLIVRCVLTASDMDSNRRDSAMKELERESKAQANAETRRLYQHGFSKAEYSMGQAAAVYRNIEMMHGLMRS